MADDPGPDGLEAAGERRADEILVQTGVRLRRDPWLIVPFFILGLGLMLVDWLRRVDPIPVFEAAPTATGGLDITIEYVGYPAGVTETERAFESLIGLEVPYLLWGIGLEVLVLLAVSLAGGLTIARAMDTHATTVSLMQLFGFVTGVTLLFRALGAIEALQGMGLAGVIPLLLVLYLFVRLFAVAGCIIAGQSIGAAIRQSSRRTRGRGWTVVGLVLVVGLLAWLLAFVPYAGAFLSTTVVAPIHAVAIAVFLEDR